jgi:hypothetical protein
MPATNIKILSFLQHLGFIIFFASAQIGVDQNLGIQQDIVFISPIWRS